MTRWFSLIALLLALCGCTQTATRRIVVASDLANKPFAFVDDDEQRSGIEVELITVISDRLGLTVDWSRREFEELLPACVASEVDVVAATLGITPEREREMLFSRPYFRTRIALVVRAGASEPQSHADLDGLKVRASRGTTSERALRRSLPNATIVLTGKDAAAIASELESGAVAGAIMDGPDATRLVAASNGALRELPPLSEENYAFAFAPTRGDLRREFDAALREMETSGALRALLVKFGIESP